MAETRATVAEAARRLGLTEDGVRKRVRRGSLPHVREQGRIYVLLDAVQDEAETVSDESKTGETPADTALVEQLRSENAYLREALRRAQDGEAEQRRLLAATIGRVPELAPPASSSAPEAPAQRPAWWRRLVGR